MLSSLTIAVVSRPSLVWVGLQSIYERSATMRIVVHHHQQITSDLTVREHEVVRLMQQGLSNKEIACKLLISDNTVRHHLPSIFDKVGASNRKKLMVHNHQVHSTHA
ncbi:MAG: helix-turn-helix transcriptional regulator [Nitrospira sp.]|nr:helix-turn-helix transcriptional regulator [Nitrospira sp.]